MKNKAKCQDYPTRSLLKTENLKYFNNPPVRMEHLIWMYGAKPSIMLFAILVCLVGCSHPEPGFTFVQVVSNVSAANSLQPTITSPCGVLYLREPVVNLTGSFSAPVKKGSYVYLYIAPNVTVGTVLKVIQDCTPIKKEAVDKDGQFSLTYLPVGNYIALIPSSAFKNSPGYPIIEDPRSSALEMTRYFRGKGADHVTSVFSLSER